MEKYIDILKLVTYFILTSYELYEIDTRVGNSLNKNMEYFKIFY